MKKNLLTSDPKLSSPVQIDENRTDMLSAVFLDTNKSPSLCPVFLTTVARYPKSTLCLLRVETVGGGIKMLLEGLDGEGLDIPAFS